ncbi:hypothetical protein BOC52_01260 [Burkholderia pseudomallei]|nr:hypothetical protein BOC39_00180 [Burkholderia pseudomallei]ARL57925.1 hypothetical protein BOC52_01260 [Burkholderia pseudomallei]ARL64961.1 hypothetical protein BOC53_06615 [Burkholderia pseudomallei]
MFCIPRGDPRATIPRKRKRKRERACAVRVVRHSRRAIHRFTDPPIHRAQAAQRAAYTGAPAPAPLARIFPARRSVRMPCYQTESFPPRAIAR